MNTIKQKTTEKNRWNVKTKTENQMKCELNWKWVELTVESNRNQWNSIEKVNWNEKKKKITEKSLDMNWIVNWIEKEWAKQLNRVEIDEIRLIKSLKMNEKTENHRKNR